MHAAAAAAAARTHLQPIHNVQQRLALVLLGHQHLVVPLVLLQVWGGWRGRWSFSSMYENPGGRTNPTRGGRAPGKTALHQIAAFVPPVLTDAHSTTAQPDLYEQVLYIQLHFAGHARRRQLGLDLHTQIEPGAAVAAAAKAHGSPC